MAVSVNAVMSGGNADSGRCQTTDNGTSCSSTGITVASGATLLVATIHIYSASNPSPGSLSGTWAGGAITLGPTGNVGGSALNAIFYKINPTVGAQTLTINWDDTGDAYMSAVAFNGTDTTTGINASDSVNGTSGTTVTITSTTDGATVASWGTDGAAPTTNFNTLFSYAALDPGAGASYQLGGTSNAHTFTGAGGSNPAWTGVHVLAGAAPAGQPTTKRQGGIQFMSPQGHRYGLGMMRWKMRNGLLTPDKTIVTENRLAI